MEVGGGEGHVGRDARGVEEEVPLVVDGDVGLEGRRLPGMHGPTTFGEIGYQLLNQTLVYLSLVPAE